MPRAPSRPPSRIPSTPSGRSRSSSAPTSRSTRREDDAVERIRDGLPWRPDVVFDCVANQASTDQAIALALKGGTVVVEGVPRGDVRVPLPLIQDRELRLQGTAMYTREDVERAIDLIERAVVPAGRLVTAEFPIERAAEAFQAAADGTEIKVHLRL